MAALLSHPPLSCYARFGLEPNPDPSVDDALRDALPKLKGPRQVGVTTSNGVRRDAKALDLLTKLIDARRFRRGVCRRRIGRDDRRDGSVQGAPGGIGAHHAAGLRGVCASRPPVRRRFAGGRSGARAGTLFAFERGRDAEAREDGRLSRTQRRGSGARRSGEKVAGAYRRGSDGTRVDFLAAIDSVLAPQQAGGHVSGV